MRQPAEELATIDQLTLRLEAPGPSANRSHCRRLISWYEIFANSDKIKLEFEDIEGEIRTTETSADPNVTLLIRRHARAVDSYVAEGMARMHEPTPLPEVYEPSTK